MNNLLFSEISQLIKKDINCLNSYMLNGFNSNIELINKISKYIVSSGGKRLRPILSILVAKSCGYQGEDHAVLAAIIEMLHTATLLHDDVVDNSQMRRGKKTANTVWKNPETILVGDFLYSRAFQLMVKLNNQGILSVLANATNKISEGEVLQLINIGNTEITEDLYIEILKQKTAMLFQAASQTAAMLANAPRHIESSLKDYGRAIGIAFQLIDDVLDYSGDVSITGKKIGDDIFDGKMTMPVIYLLKNGNLEQKKLIEHIFNNNNTDRNIEQLIAAVVKSDALEYAKMKALEYARQAENCIAQIPNSKYKDGLQKVIKFSVNRLS